MTAYAGHQHARLVYSLQKLPDDRDSQDLLLISSYLGECALFDPRPVVSDARELQLLLFALGRAARYESHASNTVLYRQGEISNCWYVLLTGLVFIEGRMYSPGVSFGKPEQGAAHRQADCVVLEPSEMLVLPSDAAQAFRSPEPALADPAQAAAVAMSGADATSSAASELAMYKSMQLPQLASVAQQASAFSDSSSSSARSTSSVSADDVDLDMALNDSLIDSDDEDGYAESTVSTRDPVRDALEKYPGDRTQEDIEVLLEFMHNLLPTFAKMTMATRRALCAVMVYAVVEKAGTMVMNDGEELDSWSAILNGKVEITMHDGSTKTLQMGDCFGIRPSKEKEQHKGVMRTLVDNCQFVCIAQDDYYGILNEEQANVHTYMENGETILVTEMRELDGGARKGTIVIRGTPQRLINHLVEDQSAVDATFVEDFLLTYRTFLPSPLLVANQLLAWFKDNKQLRVRVTRVMLLWVNNHFNDFESNPDMIEILHSFEQMLEAESMLGQLRMLHLACQAKARVRSATLTRAARNEPLPFVVAASGEGRPSGNKLFITRVELGNRAQECGLRRGDQLLEVNGYSLLDESGGTSTSAQATTRAMDMLQTATHLYITVRSNLLDFHDMATKSDAPQKAFAVRNAGTSLIKLTTVPPPDLSPGSSSNDKDVASDGGIAAHRPIINAGKKHKDGRTKDKTATMGHSSKDKLLKALKHMKLIPKGSPLAMMAASRVGAGHDTNDGCAVSRPRSNSDPDIKGTLQRSNSSPDVAALALGGIDFGKGTAVFPEHILKIYRADQTYKFLHVSKETTVRDVVVMALRQFGISDHGNLHNITCNNYSLCEVSVESGGLVKQKRLPDTLGNLAEKIGVHSRYYLKNNMVQETLVSDEAALEMAKEGRFTFLTLSCQELAMQLSIADYAVFQQIEATEYVDELCHVQSKYGYEQLLKFSELINKEMFWVATEVCSECNIVRRAKTLKHFIKVARYCKEFRNFNATFAIVSGLGHGTVSRLRSTWERLPGKYIKMFTDLESFMDPTRNMAKYRNLLHSVPKPPVIPFFPIVKKDLTFIHLGNDTKVDGLVNFEKMRMISKEVRQIMRLASSQYTVNDMLYGMGTTSSSGSVFHGFADASSESNVSGFVTTRRKKRGSQVLQPKKMYEEAQMARCVKAYLSELAVEQDEDRLLEMSFKCEPNRRMETSSQGSTLSVGSNSSSTGSAQASGPKFGSSSPEAVRKLMSLSEGTKPVNQKKRHPQPVPSGSSQPSPLLGIRSNSAVFGGMTTMPSQPHHSRSVDLSSESSSVVSLGSISRSRKTSNSSTTSGSRETPQEVRKSYPQVVMPWDRDNDSGHCSFASSGGFDAQSTCSINSIGSPLLLQKHMNLVLGVASAAADGAAVVAAAHRRPPLPSYETLMRESAAASSHPRAQPRGVVAKGLPPSINEGKHLPAAVAGSLRHSVAGLSAYVGRAYNVDRSHGSSQRADNFDSALTVDDDEGVVSMV